MARIAATRREAPLYSTRTEATPRLALLRDEHGVLEIKKDYAERDAWSQLRAARLKFCNNHSSFELFGAQLC